MKPPYRVPSMDEIRGIPYNGLTVVSTFSGAGGSSLGYRMAGYRVLLASEFVAKARETYRANFPDTLVDDRDIRSVDPAEWLDRLKMKAGELDILDGSPPCASFSTAGKREKGWGQVNEYSDTAQRSDDLFFEFARILRGLQPRVFVAENVSGLVKGTAKGYFQRIMRELKVSGYDVRARLLDAQWLGVPQARQRVIFVGVRADLGIEPQHPEPLTYRYTVRDACPHIRALRLSGAPDNWKPADRPAGTVVQSDGGRASRTAYMSSYMVEAETDISGYAIGQEYDSLKEGEQSGRYFNLVRTHRDRPSPTITASGGSTSTAAVTHPTEKRKFSIAELRRICGFPDDFVLTGSFAEQWERLGRAVPPVMMCHIATTIRDRVLNKEEAV